MTDSEDNAEKNHQEKEENDEEDKDDKNKEGEDKQENDEEEKDDKNKDGEDKEDNDEDKDGNEGEEDEKDEDKGGKQDEDVFVKQAFDWLDKNEDGKIAPKEVFQQISELDKGMTEKMAEHWVHFFDADGDKTMNFKEFKIAQAPDQMTADEEVDGYFRITDTNKDDKVSLEEVEQFWKELGLSEGLSDKEEEEQANLFLKDFRDAAGEDEELTRDEFKVVLEAQKKTSGSADEGGNGDLEDNEDVLEVEEDIEEASGLLKKDAQRRLVTVKKMQHLLQRFNAKHLQVPSVSSTSWFTPASGGLIMVPLLVAAFGCRRRLRTPGTPEFEQVAEE